ELDQAEVMYGESLALHEELGDKIGMAHTYRSLGTVFRERGDLAQAEVMYRKSLTLFPKKQMSSEVSRIQNLLKDIGAVD
ncbi:tetratricopeptide repeat protein, partial [uncultured Nitrospira sp.]|uniref:tetratricopeptide repeat protein n=1 Tax=uncultured Nitrospira sp. TaxID=157176 RepID=UPI00313FFA22